MERFPSFSDVQQKIVAELKKHANGLSQSQISQHLHISEASVSRHMSMLLKEGWVLRRGSRKASVLSLHPQIVYWSTPAHLRPPVAFDLKVIQDYEPNKTSWLSQDVAQVLSSFSPQERLDASTYAKGVLERFLIDLSFASSSMEGNTYTQLETEALIKYGEQAEGKPLQDATMILNHKMAISFVLENLDNVLDESFVFKLHSLLMRGLLSHRSLGAVRSCDVSIGGSSYVPSTDPVVLRLGLSQVLFKSEQIKDPFESMIFLLSNVSYLQVFEDGNKRLARILANVPLLRHGLSPLSFVGVDKKSYIQGLLEFYEQHDPSTLSKAVARGYAQTAPMYARHRPSTSHPKTVELKHRFLLDELMKEILENNIQGDALRPYVTSRLSRFGASEKEDLLEVVEGYIKDLSPHHAVL